MKETQIYLFYFYCELKNSQLFLSIPLQKVGDCLEPFFHRRVSHHPVATRKVRAEPFDSISCLVLQNPHILPGSSLSDACMASP